MKITVLGASRGVGLATVRDALDRGHDVSVVARSQPPVDAVDWTRGDARDAHVVASALEGSDAVVTCIGTKAAFRATTLFSDMATAVVEAMASCGVQRHVAVTGFGAGDSRGHGGLVFDHLVMPLVANRLYQDKDREEAIIRAHDHDWTIVRPGFLRDGPAAGVVALTSPRDFRLGSITRASVAAFMLDCVETGAYLRQSPVIINGT